MHLVWFAVEYNHEYCYFLLSPLAVKREIAVTIFLRCMCVRVCMHALHACECPSGFDWVITLIFMHGFQNYLTQFLLLRRSSVIEGQMTKWSLISLSRPELLHLCMDFKKVLKRCSP